MSGTITPIDCDLHDYVEIACMFDYEVVLTCEEGRRIQGRAVTTHTRADKVEELWLETTSGLLKVPLHELTHMRVLTSPARFQCVGFK